MSQYVVTTPRNPGFSGRTCGIDFRNGRAFVSEHTLDPNLGLTVDQVIWKMVKDFGYDVEQVGGASLDLMKEDVVVITPTKTASKKRQSADE